MFQIPLAAISFLYLAFCTEPPVANDPKEVPKANTPPAVPASPSPASGAIGQATSLTLEWACSDPDGDTLSYDVYFGTNSNPTTVVSFNQIGTTTIQSGLSNSTAYHWKVTARDSKGGATTGSIWSFTTEAIGLAPNAPALITPANNASNINASPILRWEKSPGATHYALQVSESVTFGNCAYNQTGLTGTSQQVTGLSYSTSYYWRVYAANAGGVSEYSPVFSFVTQPPPPPAPQLIAPANNATGVGLLPTLAWEAIAGAASYTLHVSADMSFSTFVYINSLNGTSQHVSGLSSNTIYYWRVSATNVYGPSVYSNVFRFTTKADVPDVPVPVSPANSATNVNLLPTLTWRPGAGATSYHLQVSASDTFESFVYNQSGLVGTSQQVVGLNPFTRYYWRVSAANTYGASGYSSVYSFTTVPETPLPLLPANNASNVTLPVLFTWTASTGAAGYTLQVSTNSTFNSYSYHQSGLTGTSHQISGLKNSTTYFWRVCAENAGGTSSYSPVYTFGTTQSAPNAPTPSYPPNNATNVNIAPTVTWVASAGAAGYTLQVSLSNTFSSYVFNQNGLTGTAQQVAGLEYNTTYYWRLSAENAGGASPFSSTFNFSTVPPPPPAPDAPTLATPTNNAYNVSLQPILVWNQSPRATTYRLQVSTSLSFSSFVFNQSGLTGTSQQISGLGDSSEYYWRVNATNTYGTSVYSKVYKFTTVPPPPNAPRPTAPENNAVNVNLPPTFAWNAAYSSISFTLQVSTNSAFSNYAFNQGGLTATSQAVSGLSPNTTYYWRVSATNMGGSSGYSSVYHFTTSNACPGIPTLTYGGKTYHTVQIGSQCWLKENLDVGTMMPGTANPTNNGVIEKYCYEDSPTHCTSYGGLYQWNEAMGYASTPGSRGICPGGWHIPTLAELQTLSSAVAGNSNALKAVGQGAGSGAGTNSSGFSALLAGYRGDNGSFFDLSNNAQLWSSSEYSTKLLAHQMFLQHTNGVTYFNAAAKTNGASVRCVKD